MAETQRLEIDFNNDMLRILEREGEADLRSTRFRQTSCVSFRHGT
jgi:hypothetical protein